MPAHSTHPLTPELDDYFADCSLEPRPFDPETLDYLRLTLGPAVRARVTERAEQTRRA